MAGKSQRMLAAAAWPERCDGHRAVKVQAAESAGVACGWAQEVPGAGGPGSRLAVEAKAAEAMAVVARLMEVVMVAKGAVVTVAMRGAAAKGRR